MGRKMEWKCCNFNFLLFLIFIIQDDLNLRAGMNKTVTTYTVLYTFKIKE